MDEIASMESISWRKGYLNHPLHPLKQNNQNSKNVVNTKKNNFCNEKKMNKQKKDMKEDYSTYLYSDNLDLLIYMS